MSQMSLDAIGKQSKIMNQLAYKIEARSSSDCIDILQV